MLKGRCIDLTELRSEDSADLFGWINDPQTVQFNAPFTPVHAASHDKWFEDILGDPKRIIFAIRKPKGRLLGVVQLIDIDPVHRTAELTIRIGDEKNRNQGAGSEAVKLVVDFAFRNRNLQRVWLRVFATNKRAIRAYEKAGVKQEGILRRSRFIDGRWVDEIVMAILRDKP
jgi:RimJ/RimL family protein N-acetyltransferase